MNWETLYEVSENPFPTEFVIGAGLCCWFLFPMIKKIKEAKNNGQKINKDIITDGIIVFVLLTFTLLHGFLGSGDQLLAKEYYSGNYSIYEGEIIEYQKKKSDNVSLKVGEETFTITGIIKSRKVPKEGYVKVYMVNDGSYDIARIDRRIE